MNVQIKEGHYNGSPTLEFWDMDAPPNPQHGREILQFTIGLKKARILLASLEALKEFVECYKDKP